MPREAPVTRAVLLERLAIFIRLLGAIALFYVPFAGAFSHSILPLSIKGEQDRERLPIEEAIDLENEILVVLVPGTMVGIRIEDELGVRHILDEIE